MISGYPYIDVGCFQVDIAYHAGVFPSLDDAFDPEKNAQAAAKILLTERSRSPDWDTAVARYHSATPSLGSAYLDRVRTALPSAKLRALFAQAESAAAPEPATPAPVPRNLPVVIYGTPLPSHASTARSAPRKVQAQRLLASTQPQPEAP